MLVNYNDFGNGNTILVFDLTARGECNSEQFTVRKLENVRINLKYSNALTETNNLILYGEFDGVLQKRNYRLFVKHEQQTVALDITWR